MSQNITWLGNSYSDVGFVDFPKTGGGTVRFDDASVTTAVESDVASGKVFLLADGSVGTGSAVGPEPTSNCLYGSVTITERTTKVEFNPGVNNYRYMTFFFQLTALAKPGYKAFFAMVMDFKLNRTSYGYTNNTGTGSIGNFTNHSATYASDVVTRGSDGLITLWNSNDTFSGETFGYFMPGTYEYCLWGDM